MRLVFLRHSRPAPGSDWSESAKHSASTAFPPSFPQTPGLRCDWNQNRNLRTETAGQRWVSGGPSPERCVLPPAPGLSCHLGESTKVKCSHGQSAHLHNILDVGSRASCASAWERSHPGPPESKLRSTSAGMLTAQTPGVKLPFGCTSVSFKGHFPCV